MNKKKIAICLSIVVVLAVITYYAGNYFYIQSLPKVAIEMSNVNVTTSNMTVSFTLKNVGSLKINQIIVSVIDTPIKSTPINCSLPTFASINVNFVFTIMSTDEALNNGLTPYNQLDLHGTSINQTINGAIVTVRTPLYGTEDFSYYLGDVNTPYYG